MPRRRRRINTLRAQAWVSIGRMQEKRPAHAGNPASLASRYAPRTVLCGQIISHRRSPSRASIEPGVFHLAADQAARASRSRARAGAGTRAESELISRSLLPRKRLFRIERFASLQSRRLKRLPRRIIRTVPPRQFCLDPTSHRLAERTAEIERPQTVRHHLR